MNIDIFLLRRANVKISRTTVRGAGGGEGALLSGNDIVPLVFTIYFIIDIVGQYRGGCVH